MFGMEGWIDPWESAALVEARDAVRALPCPDVHLQDSPTLRGILRIDRGRHPHRPRQGSVTIRDIERFDVVNVGGKVDGAGAPTDFRVTLDIVFKVREAIQGE